MPGSGGKGRNTRGKNFTSPYADDHELPRHKAQRLKGKYTGTEIVERKVTISGFSQVKLTVVVLNVYTNARERVVVKIKVIKIHGLKINPLKTYPEEGKEYVVYPHQLGME